MQGATADLEDNLVPVIVEKDKVEPWLIALWLMALSPLVFAIATWDSDGKLTAAAFSLRHYSIPVVVFEIIVVWVAVRAGFQPKEAILNLPKPVRWAIGMWLAFAIGSTLISATNIAPSLFLTLRYIVHGFALAATVFLIGKSDRFSLESWLKVLTIGAFLYFLSLVIFVVLIPNPDSFIWDWRLPSATNIRQIGNNFSLLLIAPVTVLLARESIYRVYYFLVVTAIIAFIAWTGTRGALFGFTLGTVVGILTTAHFTTLRNIFILFISILMGLIVSIPAFTPTPAFGVFRMIFSISSQDSSSGRMELWRTTIQEIIKQPFWGHGSGTFRENVTRFYEMPLNHPHNVILQFVYDWGIFGGGAALAILAWIGYRVFSANNEGTALRFLAVAGFTSTIAIAMIDGTLFNPMQILICIAMILPSLALSQTRKVPTIR